MKKKKHSIGVNAIRQGLVMAIPFLMLGSFSLVFSSLPIPVYQQWLAGFWGGRLLGFFQLLYGATLDSLALILCITISASFGRSAGRGDCIFYVLVSVGSYFVFTGCPSVTTENVFAPEWAFTSICVTLFSCMIFRALLKFFGRFEGLHTVGVDYLFNLSIQAFGPVVLTLLLFAGTGLAVKALAGDNGTLNFGSYFFLRLFGHLGNNLFSILLYVFISHLLWFFGIHGTNTLEAVSTRLFEQGIATNEALAAAGQMPTEIYTKTFLDVFVFMGGCGTALCFILALLIAARKPHNKRLAGLSALPVFFNISEIAIFGFPIIFNPLMIIPFILTPLALVLVSAASMQLGLVPPAIHSVGWTVPVFFSGYEATGSFAGCVLQGVNILLGILIYIPFVRLSERRQAEDVKSNIRGLETDMRQGEEVGRIPNFLQDSYPLRETAKTMSMDLLHALETGKLELYYQPQVHMNGAVAGAEALLRWHHPVAGFVFPPLIITLAEQNGMLDKLGLWTIEQACADMAVIGRCPGRPKRISVNVSPYQLENPEFTSQVQRILEQHDHNGIDLMLEVTERVALSSTPVIEERLARLRAMGVKISMDDFGMGHSSMMYLNNSTFDEVKLDGALVKHLLSNTRSQEIISTITSLAESLHFDVVAEYVETEEQTRLLSQLGCNTFQGYFYSQALPLPDLIDFLNAREQV